MRSVWCLILCAWSGKMLAQTPAEELAHYSALYPTENAVFTHVNEVCRLVFENGKLVIKSDIDREIMILTAKGTLYNSSSVFTDSFIKMANLDACTLVPEKNKYKKKPCTDIQQKSNMGESSFYDDRISTKIVYPFMQEGCKTQLKYQEIVSDPHFFGQFFFSNYLKTNSFLYSVTFPATVKLSYKEFNTAGYDINFEKKESKGQVTYTWTAKNLPKYRDDDHSPAPRHVEPHIILYIEEYQLNKQTEKVFDGVDGLYRYYSTLVKNCNKADNAGLRQVVDSIIKGSTTSKQKAERIFDWVENKVRYVAFEDGLGGFVPRDAVDVYTKRFGDCKDMANLLQQMMSMAGLKAYLTWIGTRDLPYSYSVVPTLSCDNHMIATFEDDDQQFYFMDATGKDHPFGFYTSMIQGKEALIGISEDRYKVMVVPEMSPDHTITYDSLKVNIADKDMVFSEGVLSLSGFEKYFLAPTFKSLPYDTKKKYLRERLEIGNNKFTLDTLSYTDAGKSNPLRISYKGKTPDYIKRNKNEIYVNLHFEKGTSSLLIDKENRKTDYEFEMKHIKENYVEFKIPAGHKVSYLPASVKLGNEKYSTDISYEVKGDRIIMRKTFTLNTLLIKTGEFDEWNKYIKNLVSNANESVVLISEK